MNSDKPSIEEQPKKNVAKKVITPKRRYFLPDHNVSVEAESMNEAIAMVENSNNQKEGDVK